MEWEKWITLDEMTAQRSFVLGRVELGLDLLRRHHLLVNILLRLITVIRILHFNIIINIWIQDLYYYKTESIFQL